MQLPPSGKAGSGNNQHGDGIMLLLATAVAARGCLHALDIPAITPSGPDETFKCRNRGTEYIKSPEMLKCALADNKGRSDYDRRKNEGAGAASDVWSLGCLLFELVAGHFLFFDPDWISFFMRITQQQEVRLSVFCYGGTARLQQLAVL